MVIREGLDSDSEELIALIASIFAEYPGCVLDVDGEGPSPTAPRERVRRLGRRSLGGRAEWADGRMRRLR